MKTPSFLLSLILLSILPRLCTAAYSLTPVMRISAGSLEDYVDTNGDVWSADMYFENGTTRDAVRNIRGTLDDELYYKLRTRGKGFTYEIPAVDLGVTSVGEEASFQVELHFCDINKQAAGERIMDVLAQGQLVLDDLDVFAAAGGRYRPHTETFNVSVVAGSSLKLQFKPVVDKPVVSALHISKIETSDPTASPTQEPSTSTPDENQFDFPSTGPHQPFIQIVEHPGRRSAGCVSMPEGAPWCPNNAPAVWWIGHDNTPERPVCQAPDGSWSKDIAFAQLDTNDPLNDIDGPSNIDRHDCAINDNNADGIPDLICVVGANSGKGYGFTEVYVTQDDGSVSKILEGHGLHKYPTMRTRQIEPLRSASGEPMVMIATRGAPRSDGLPNHHRMFKQVSFGPALSDIFFEEVDGPFIKENKSMCLVIADLNNDGVDDFISCVDNKRTDMYVQNPDSTWSEINLSVVDNKDYVEDWNTARVADVDGDGVNDLVVVSARSVRIFLGDSSLQESTLFDFTQPYWEQELPYDVYSVEVLDTNDDGAMDVYVTQVNTEEGSYCDNFKRWVRSTDSEWKRDPGLGQSPPPDEAADYLFLGNVTPTGADDDLFTRVVMDHALPGCGFQTRLWNDKGIQLGNGDFHRPGEHAILQW